MSVEPVAPIVECEECGRPGGRPTRTGGAATSTTRTRFGSSVPTVPGASLTLARPAARRDTPGTCPCFRRPGSLAQAPGATRSVTSQRQSDYWLSCQLCDVRVGDVVGHPRQGPRKVNAGPPSRLFVWLVYRVASMDGLPTEA
jgi:hypothetical protein